MDVPQFDRDSAARDCARLPESSPGTSTPWPSEMARATLDSAVGRYESEWRIEDDGSLKYGFVIPFNAAAVVELPDANLTDVMVNGLTLAEIAEDVQQTGSTVTFSLAAGRYEICYQPTQIYLIHYSTERSFGPAVGGTRSQSRAGAIYPRLCRPGQPRHDAVPRPVTSAGDGPPPTGGNLWCSARPD